MVGASDGEAKAVSSTADSCAVNTTQPQICYTLSHEQMACYRSFSLLACESTPQMQLQITEVLARNTRGIVDADNGLTSDWIELHNPSSRAIGLEGYALSDTWRPSGVDFPYHVLQPDEYMVVFASGTDASCPQAGTP